MFSGVVSKRSERVVASANIINADADILVISGSVVIKTILPKTGGVASQEVTLIPLAAGLATDATGNIAVAVALVQNRAQKLTWSDSQNKWYPAIAAV